MQFADLMLSSRRRVMSDRPEFQQCEGVAYARKRRQQYSQYCSSLVRGRCTAYYPGVGRLEIDNADSFVEQIADAVVNRIDEHEKINLIAAAVMERLREMEAKAEES